MKVIERGSFTKKIKCPTCASKLEYDLSDVELIDSEEELFNQAYQVIYCPVCNSQISLVGQNAFPLNCFN